MKNHWKRWFLLILGLNIAIILSLLILLFLPTESNKLGKQKAEEETLVSFPVKTNKEDLNKIINHYIQEESSKGAIAYEVYLEDDVELHGTMPFFGEDIGLKLTFEPQALNNGDLLLKQKSISIGRLHLPVSYVMRFIANQYKMPDWVIIQPKEETVYVALSKMKLKNDWQIKVNTFDLINDEIELTFGIPTK